jgi:small conductance mechanosensitive channel
LAGDGFGNAEEVTERSSGGWRVFNRARQDDAEGRESTYAERVRQMRKTAAEGARRARRQVLLLLPLIAAVILAYHYRRDVFGLDLEVKIAAVIALVILGWAFARDLGRALGPILFKRLDPGTAGTVGFVIRLVTLGLSVLVALRLAGLHTHTLAVGGAITAVVFGLAAQQTLGNLIAGTVLLSARPFRVGDRIRLQSGNLAGQVEGTVVSLGLLYTTLAAGEDRIMVPNNVVLSSAVVPLREPAAVDLRARLDADVKPTQIEELLEERVTVNTRQDPHIDLEEFDGEEVVVRVSATPVDRGEGARLAGEVLGVLGEVRG